MKTMEQEEKPQQPPPLPVLPRLDRLDRLLQLLEERHSTSGRHISNPILKNTKQPEEEEDPRKSLTSALADVHKKGTLMDRLAILENRVLKLSLEIDEGNTSRSSSSNVVEVSKIHGHDLVVSKGSTHDDDQVVVAHDAEKKQPPASIQERPSDEECIATTLTEERSGTKREKRKGYSKWIGLFRCGHERQWKHNRMDLR